MAFKREPKKLWYFLSIVFLVTGCTTTLHEGEKPPHSAANTRHTPINADEFDAGLPPGNKNQQTCSSTRPDTGELIAYLEKNAGISEQYTLKRGTKNAPTKLSKLITSLSASHLQQRFGKPDRIEKRAYPYIADVGSPLQKRGERWLYGHVGLFILDGKIKEFADYRKTDPPNWETRYKWKSKWDLGKLAAEGVTIRDVKSKNGKSLQQIRVHTGQKGRVPFIGGGRIGIINWPKDAVSFAEIMEGNKKAKMEIWGFAKEEIPAAAVLDLPGSREVRIEIDLEVKETKYAGLIFTIPCILEIQKDGTLLANREGIVAKDVDGGQWQNRKFQLGDESVIAFFPVVSSAIINTEPVNATPSMALKKLKYPFRSMSVQQIRETDVYKKVREAFGPDFDDIREGRLDYSLDLGMPKSSTLLHDLAPARLRETSGQVLATPVSESNYHALFALVIFAKEWQDRLLQPPYDDFSAMIDAAQMRALAALLYHICQELPDSDLRRTSVEAMIDCTNIIRKAEIAIAWRKSGSTFWDKGDPSIFLDNVVRTFKAYHSIKNSSKDPHIRMLIDEALEYLNLAASKDPKELAEALDKQTKVQFPDRGLTAGTYPTPDWETRYKWKSKWTFPFGAEGVIVKDVKGKDNKIYTGIDLFEKGKGNIPFVGNRMVVDLPGSRDVHIEIDSELKMTTYAGLTFTTPCVLEMQKDSTLLANKEGIIAKDENGKSWKSQKLEVSKKKIIAFFPMESQSGGMIVQSYAQDAWTDKEILRQEFSSDWAGAAKILQVQRLYINSTLIGSLGQKLSRAAISKKYPPDRQFHADPLVVSITLGVVGSRQEASRKRLYMQRHGRLIIGSEIIDKGKEVPDTVSLVGIDMSATSKVVDKRDNLHVALSKGDKSHALSLVNDLLLSFPNDFELFLTKARILANMARQDDATIAAKQCRSLLEIAMSRVRESTWYKKIQGESNLERLATIGYLKGYLQGIHAEATELSDSGSAGGLGQTQNTYKKKDDGLTVTGVLVNEYNNPIEGKRIYVFGLLLPDKVLTEISEGRISNPHGLSNTKGHFEIIVPFTFLKKHKTFVTGLFNILEFKPEVAQRGGRAMTFGIDSSNLGKTFDVGTITVEQEYGKTMGKSAQLGEAQDSSESERTSSGTPFQHEAFNIILPVGWKVVKNPEKGFEIGFTDDKSPRAKWYLHYEVMPEGAGKPPSDPGTLHTMASQFENLVRQQFPRARKISPDKRMFPGKTLVHQLYELKENGIRISRRYVYLFAYDTAYVIQSSVPKERVDEVTPGIEMLFRTFKPRPGAKPIPRTVDQSLNNLKSNLPKLVASMPAEWKGTIREVKFLNDSPNRGEVSLIITVRWPREELKGEFVSAKETLTLLNRGETATVAVTQTTVDLVEYVGQILGLAVGEVHGVEPEVTYLAVSMIDAKDNKVGIVRIRTKDLMKIIVGDIQPKEAISLYQFE